MKKIYIRVDGNEEIATGHVMRCLSIAEQLRKSGAEVIFLLADGRPSDLIEERQFQWDVLHTTWDNLDLETDVLCEYIKRHHISVLLMDTYYVTEKYLKNLSKYTKVIYIDDLKQFPYPVHTIINYDVWSHSYDMQAYKTRGYNPRILLGGKYVPLRKEFNRQSFVVAKKVEKVLVTTGGTDSLNVAGSFLQHAVKRNKLQDLEYHIIAGCFNCNTEMLCQLASRHPGIILHQNVSNMAEWMRACDVAISAAGTTIYELCACGIPSICFELADNQSGADVWQTEGYMLYAGNAMLDIEDCVENCCKHLLYYMNHPRMRKKYSLKLQRLVDGHGVERIADYIMTL